MQCLGKLIIHPAKPGQFQFMLPEITLNIHDKTEKTATIAIKPDIESAKDALITFVGNYNQAISELNILSQNKPELIEELDYLSEDEKETEREKRIL